MKSKEFQGFRQALLQWESITKQTSWRGLKPRTFVVESEFRDYNSPLFPSSALIQKFLEATSLKKIKDDPKLSVFIETYRMLMRHLEKGHNTFFFSRCDVGDKKYKRICEHCASLPPIRAVKLFDILRNNNHIPYTATPSEEHPGHFLTAKECIERQKHTAFRDQHHPSRFLESKFLRCIKCDYNGQSIQDLKKHAIMMHPGKKIIQMNICGSTKASGNICTLSFKTATQLKKHRILKSHFGLGRGHSV